MPDERIRGSLASAQRSINDIFSSLSPKKQEAHLPDAHDAMSVVTTLFGFLNVVFDEADQEANRDLPVTEFLLAYLARVVDQAAPENEE